MNVYDHNAYRIDTHFCSRCSKAIPILLLSHFGEYHGPMLCWGCR